MSKYSGEMIGSSEGLLIVRFVNKHDEERIGSISANDFDLWKANLFCRYLGYATGKWGSYRNGTFKHVPE